MNRLQHLLPSPTADAVFGKAATPLSSLDCAFAHFLNKQLPSDEPRHLWLAALTSHQWTRGHACLDLALLHELPAQVLGWTQEQAQQLPAQLAQTASTLPWTHHETSPLVLHTSTEHPQGLLYLRRAWRAEQSIRQSIAQRLAQPHTIAADLQQQLDDLFPNVASDDMQRKACEVAATQGMALITGGPGTGKTTTVVKLLALLVGQAHASGQHLRIHLAAPTGKAAARLSESIQNALSQHALSNALSAVQDTIPTQTQTLHRLLNSNSRRVQPLASDVVVIDEASMIDLEMMARLMQSVDVKARLILLGDKDQLASVEAGAVMAQLCGGALLREQTVTLTHSHRFDAQSGIGQWAKTVNADHNASAVNALWDSTPQGFVSATHNVTRISATQLHHSGFAQGVRQAWQPWLDLLAPHQQGQACDDAQALALLQSFSHFCVLCALREGSFGVNQLNAQIAQALHMGEGAWYVGRPVMVTRNNYALDVMNGDIGMCLPSPQGGLRVAFADGANAVRWINPSRLDSVETVFAMTVHKSQGSEFRHVLLVLPPQDAPVLTRELIYTGITRAKERLTLWAPRAEVLIRACGARVLRSGGLG